MQLNKQFLKNIITSNNKADTISLALKIVLINSFLIICFICMCLMLIYLLILQINNIYIPLICVILTPIIFLLLRYKKDIRFAVFLYNFMLIFLGIWFVYVNQSQSYGLLWSALINCTLILVNGSKKGLVLSFLYYFAICILMFEYHEQWYENGWNIIAAVRFFVVSFALMLGTMVTDYTFESFQKKLYISSITDGLTQVYNRVHIENLLKAEATNAKNMDKYLSFCIFDIDDFKRINDTYGHCAGDEALKIISQNISKNIRGNDKIGRWGGEEFCLIFPNTTLQTSHVVVERIRSIIQDLKFPYNEGLTCSFGLSSVKYSDFDEEKFIRFTDNLMYLAKNSGKNKIYSEVYQENIS